MRQFRPMLAAKTDGENITYPCLVSPKLDGVRAIVRHGQVVSRTLKPIPNTHVQRLFGRAALEGLDGELIIGDPTAEDVYRKTVSGVMSEDGKPEVKFYVFDIVLPALGYKARWKKVEARTSGENFGDIMRRLGI